MRRWRLGPRRVTLAVGATLVLGWTFVLLPLFLLHHRSIFPELFLFPSSRLWAVEFPDYFWLDWVAGDYFSPRDTVLSPLPRLRLFPKQGCKNSTFMLVMVISPAKDWRTRQLVRATWGRAVRENRWPRAALAVGLELVFVLGLSSRHDSSYLEELQVNVTKEVEQYGDLVVGDFLDTYRNLTLKTLTGLQWAEEFCPLSQFVMKVDQDTLVDVPRLTDLLLQQGPELRGAVLGKLHFNSRRQQHGKWRVSPQDYPLPLYPTFAGGPCYVLSKDVVGGIVNVSQYFPPLYLEDVQVTGILARALGLRRMHVQQLQNWRRGSLCSLLSEERGYTLSVTDLSREQLARLWDMLVEGRCDDSSSDSDDT